MKLADVSIKRPVFATMMIAALVVFGVIGYQRVGVDLFPEVDFPFVTVLAVYPGADPESIETKVVTVLEDAVAGISGVKTMFSNSMENVGQVMIQFELGVDVDQAAQEVRDKISAIQRELPSDVEPPQVSKFDIGAAPVLSVVLSGNMNPASMTELADDVVKARLQKVLGVGGITIVGGRKREVQVWVDSAKLDKHHMAVQDVYSTLGAQNLEVPGGRFPLGQDELVIKTKGEARSVKDIAELIVPIPNFAAPVRIRDVAQVVDGTEEPRSYSSLNGVSAVSLTVRKQSGANTVAVARGLKVKVAELQLELAKKGIKLAVVADMSGWIERNIHEMNFDLVFGAFLAVIIILFFLRNWRATLISAVAIPTSVIATFAFIYVMGFTLNMLTLLALSLSIGILIDDAIVVIENIYRHMEEGSERVEAAHVATGEIGLAVMATTFCIVAVFVPVAFMKGIIGRFFYQFGLTVAFAVLVSLFISFTLTPMLTSKFGAINHNPNFVWRWIERLLDRLDAAYRGTLVFALGHRALVVLTAVGILAGSLAMAGLLESEFMATEDQSKFLVRVQMPTGKGLEATKNTMAALDKEIRDIDGVNDTFITIGGGVTGTVNEGTIYVGLVRPKDRSYTQMELMGLLRDRTRKRTDATISVEDFDPMGSGDSGMKNAPVQFIIQGESLAQMEKVAGDMMAEMKKVKGLVDIDSSFEGGKPEISITVDRNRAAGLGVPVASIAMTIRSLMGGDKASQLRQEGDLYDVRVGLQPSDRERPEDLAGVSVRSSLQQLVKLSNLVQIKQGEGPTNISRRERQRQVTVTANIQDLPLGTAVLEVEKIAKKVVPKGLESKFVGMAEIMEESFQSMFFALFLAIIIVYMILASQFESFIHPFTIMLSLPMSLVGALGGLLIADAALSIFAMIGIIMLMGLVTKNAILLVDYTTTLRRQGLGKDEALLKAGPVRLRPILMTTAAMIFGMLPVALGLSEGSEGRAPMAICVIGGLITSTVLTLLVVPVVYSLLDGVASKLGGGQASRVEN